MWLMLVETHLFYLYFLFFGRVFCRVWDGREEGERSLDIGIVAPEVYFTFIKEDEADSDVSEVSTTTELAIGKIS